MTDSAPPTDLPRRTYPRLRVLYLMLVTVAVFGTPWLLGHYEAAEYWRFVGVGGLLLAQLGLLLGNRIGWLEILRACARVKWLFLFVIVCSTLLRNSDGDVLLTDRFPNAPEWGKWVNLTGLEVAALMCLQITTVILVSMLVRTSGSGTDLVDGLRGLGFPKLFVYSIDNTLDMLGGGQGRGMGGGGGGGGGGRGRGMGGGRGRRREPADESGDVTADAGEDGGLAPGFMATLRRLARGDLDFFLDAIRSGQDRARRRVERSLGHQLDPRMLHDVTIISGVGFMMMSMKILKFLPGIAFASGHKTLLLIPLYILASRLTYSRWGGTAAGSIMGVIGLMMGDGRTGVFEVFKHVVPGMVVDLTNPLVSRLPHWKIVYCVLGFVVAAFRTSTELALVFLPALTSGNLWETPELQAFPAAKLIPNLFFGTLSGLVTYFVLPAFRRPDAAGVDVSAPASESAAVEPDAAGTGRSNELATRAATTPAEHAPLPIGPSEPSDSP